MRDWARCAATVFLICTGCLEADAIDCTKALSDLDKFICNDSETKKSDADLNAAYVGLLKKTKEKDFREAIVRSQKRWLAQRAPDAKIWSGGAGDERSNTLGQEAKQFIIAASQNRTEFLASDRPIKNLQRQRALAKSDGNGKFSGYRSDCWFVDPPWGGENEYVCVGTQVRQSGKRICTETEEWASGHTTRLREVSELTGDALVTATCQEGYAGTTCPDDSNDPNSKWEVHTETGVAELTGENVSKYDLDYDLPERSAGSWMDNCVAAKTYPPLDQR